MIESGSSLFYLLHCSAYDRLNTTTFRSFRNIPHGLHQSSGHNHRCCNNFASAHPAQIASNWIVDVELQYQLCLSISRTDCILLDGNVYWWHDLCLSTSRTDCVSPYLGFRRGREPLPQHIPHGLHPTLPTLLHSTSLCLSTSRTDCISKIAQMQCHKSTQYAVSW